MASSHGGPPVFKNKVIAWIDYRLPIFSYIEKEYHTFPTPRNFNYFWNFGAIATVMLVLMIVTGIVLAMNYQPNADLAFDSPHLLAQGALVIGQAPHGGPFVGACRASGPRGSRRCGRRRSAARARA